MNDLDQLVRERLRHDAEWFLRRRGPAAISRPVRNRIRRRQTVLLSAVIVLSAAGAGGAVALTSAIIGNPVAEERPGTTGPVEMRRVTELDEAPTIADPRYAWRGIWPEVSEPAARQAQQDAMSPTGPNAWRLMPIEVAMRYAERVLDIEEFEAHGEVTDDVARIEINRTDSVAYRRAADVIVERVQGLGVSTIWSVTGLAVPATSHGDVLAEIAVADLIQRRASELTSLFMQYRIDGSTLAERFLAPDAAAAYRNHERGLYLYGVGVDEPGAQSDEPGGTARSDGHPSLDYGGFDIIAGPRPIGDGTYEALVSIDVSREDPGPIWGSPEILRIGPYDGRLMIVDVQRR